MTFVMITLERDVFGKKLTEISEIKNIFHHKIDKQLSQLQASIVNSLVSKIMFKIICLVLLAAVLLKVSARTSESLKAQLPDGSTLIGRYLTSFSGRGIRAWMGIPYAEAPVGDLRFKVMAMAKHFM